MIYNDFILDNISDLVWIINKDAKTIIISKSIEMLTDYSRNDLIEKNIKMLITPNTYSEIISILNDEKSESQNDLQITIITKSNKKIFLDAKYKVEFQNGEKILIAVLESSKVKSNSEIYKIENEKNELVNRFKSYILNILNHEFTTPLIGILGYTKLLFEDSLSEENIEMVKEIHSSALRLNATLNSVTTLAAIEGNQYNLKCEKISIRETIENVIQNYIPMLDSKSIDCKINCNDVLAIETDENFLNQIFFHLLDNAVKFTNFGSIVIDVIESDIGIKIKISDTGIGIDKNMLDNIYKPFRQGSEGHNRKYDGLGLGLTITEKLVQALSGNISIESNLSKGTTVKLEFPLQIA